MEKNNPMNRGRQGGNDPKMPRFNMNWLYWAMLIAIGILLFSGGGDALVGGSAAQEATYTKFKEYVVKGYADKVEINKAENTLKM